MTALGRAALVAGVVVLAACSTGDPDPDDGAAVAPVTTGRPSPSVTEPERPPPSAGPSTIAESTTPTAPLVVHVDPAANGGIGDADDPVASVELALAIVADGGQILLHAGVYREQVHVFEREVHLSAAGDGPVVFDGALRLASWVLDGDRWWAPWDHRHPRVDADPGADRGTHIVGDGDELAGWPDMAFLDGAELEEVASLDDLEPGRFFVDQANGRLWVADDPASHVIEASALRWAFHFNRAHGSSLTGVTVRRFATAARELAAIRAHADRVLIEDVIVTENAHGGVSLIGSDIELRGSELVDNGHLGVHGHESADLLVESSLIAGNNRERFDPFHSAGGLKITTSSGVRLVDNEVVGNDGPGLWLDLSVVGADIARNLVVRNARSGVEVELSGQVVIAGNSVLDNGEAGVWVLESNDVQVWNNLLLGNGRQLWVLDGPRDSDDRPDGVDWDANRVMVRNNIIGARAAGHPLLAVDDWTERRAAVDIGVDVDHNVYWHPRSTLSSWARWPELPARARDLETHRRLSGQDAASVADVADQNPFLDAGLGRRGIGDVGAEVPAAIRRLLVERLAGSALRPGLTGPASPPGRP